MVAFFYVMKIKTKKEIKKQLDKIWKEIIHQKGQCEICGSIQNLNAHHIIGRSNTNLRYDIKNGCLLCVKHHFSAHQNPIYFTGWLKEHRPDDYLYLKNPEHEKTRVWYISDYEEISKRLNEIQKTF